MIKPNIITQLTIISQVHNGVDTPNTPYKNITLKKSDILPVQLSGVEFSPVLKNCAVVVSSDDKGHGSLNGRSPCTAKSSKT